MFGKKSQKLETMIGDGTEIRGDLNVKGTLRIDGTLEGNIHADWVVVGESGVIKGNVNSRGTVIGGTVEGNIDAEEITELKPKARVSGEIKSGKLAISEGAVFEGRSSLRSNHDAEGETDAQVISLKPPSSLS